MTLVKAAVTRLSGCFHSALPRNKNLFPPSRIKAQQNRKPLPLRPAPAGTERVPHKKALHERQCGGARCVTWRRGGIWYRWLLVANRDGWYIIGPPSPPLVGVSLMPFVATHVSILAETSWGRFWLALVSRHQRSLVTEMLISFGVGCWDGACTISVLQDFRS